MTKLEALEDRAKRLTDFISLSQDGAAILEAERKLETIWAEMKALISIEKEEG